MEARRLAREPLDMLARWTILSLTIGNRGLCHVRQRIIVESQSDPRIGAG